MTFRVERDDFTDIPDGTVELIVKKPYPKHSRPSENYYRQLLRELAGALDISIEEAHHLMLERYGQYEMDGDDIREVYMPINWDDTYAEGVGETKMVDGVLYCKYRLLKHSKDMSAQEYAKLVSGTLEELKELGVR